MSDLYMDDDIKDPISALRLIRAISVDYDGYRETESLMDLIDELRMIAETGLVRTKELEEESKPHLFNVKCSNCKNEYYEIAFAEDISACQASTYCDFCGATNYIDNDTEFIGVLKKEE